MDFAVIFDMDGVLVDNVPLHKEAWILFLKKRGIHLTESQFKKWNGKKNSEILPDFFGGASKEEMEHLAEEKEKTYRTLARELLVAPQGLIRLLKDLRREHITTAIGTSAPTKNADLCLDTLNIRDYFSVIVDESEITKGKPDPEVYLKVAKRISFEAKNCVVIEDSLAGITAAKTAGMHVIGILSSHTKEEIPGADYYINSFEDLDLKILGKIASK